MQTSGIRKKQHPRTALLLFADSMYFQPELLPATNRLDVQIKGGRIWETFALFNSDAYKP